MWMKHGWTLGIDDKSCLSLTLHNCAASGYDTYLFLDKCSYHNEPSLVLLFYEDRRGVGGTDSPQLTPLVHRGGFSHGGVHGGDRILASVSAR